MELKTSFLEGDPTRNLQNKEDGEITLNHFIEALDIPGFGSSGKKHYVFCKMLTLQRINR